MSIEDGYMTQFVKVYVIQAEIPFLMGLETLEEWGAVINMSERDIYFETVGIVVKAGKEGEGHLKIPLGKVKFDKELSEDEEVETILFVESEDAVFTGGTVGMDYENNNFNLEDDNDKENVR